MLVHGCCTSVHAGHNVTVDCQCCGQADCRPDRKAPAYPVPELEDLCVGDSKGVCRLCIGCDSDNLTIRIGDPGRLKPFNGSLRVEQGFCCRESFRSYDYLGVMWNELYGSAGLGMTDDVIKQQTCYVYVDLIIGNSRQSE